MRNIVIIGMLLAAASTAGWFSIKRDGDIMTIDINRAEIRSDTRTMIDRGREMLDRQQQQAADRQSPPTTNTPPWATENVATGYPPERGFSAPPPNFTNTPAGYPSNSAGYNPPNYQPAGYSPSPGYGPTPNYVPQPPYSQQPSYGYPRQ